MNDILTVIFCFLLVTNMIPQLIEMNKFVITSKASKDIIPAQLLKTQQLWSWTNKNTKCPIDAKTQNLQSSSAMAMEMSNEHLQDTSCSFSFPSSALSGGVTSVTMVMLCGGMPNNMK